METSTTVTADDIDLTPVFGQLDETTTSTVLETLRRGDSTLQAAAKELELAADPLTLSTYPSGQAELTAAARGEDGKLTFEAAVRPRNFFSEHNPWRPGQPPRPMQTDAWDVEGAVNVMVRRLVGQHKYTIQETPEELMAVRYETAPDAAAALASCCERLAELMRSRDATVAAWADPDPS